MRHGGRILGAVLAAVSCAAGARVSTEEAAKLGRELTPVGAEVAANRDGTIPPWNGGLREVPACFKGAGSRYCDPFPDDRPLFTVTAANLLEHSSRLSAGQVDLFRRHPEYRMPVYPTRRSFANPAQVYEATRVNALNASLADGAEGLADAMLGVPFPITESGAEAVWNHRLRYRDPEQLRWNNQFAVSDGGEYSHTRFREEYRSLYHRDGATDKDERNLLGYFLQVVTAPDRLIGSALLVHETQDAAKRPRKAWQASPGSRRWRPSPNIGYDTPGTGADGLRTNDQLDTFSGGLERYQWKLIGKKEMLVPANSYRLHSDTVRYADIVRPGHINQDLARYELRRVWHVEATLARTATHQYKKRVLYLDEDGWQIRVVDLYDSRDRLWRVQEAHTVMAYDKAFELPVCETVYDLPSGRYLVQALNNEEAEAASRSFGESDFEPTRALRRVAK
jgi:hypothetical protein